jgi:hypothetical protein
MTLETRKDRVIRGERGDERRNIAAFDVARQGLRICPVCPSESIVSLTHQTLLTTLPRPFTATRRATAYPLPAYSSGPCTDAAESKLNIHLETPALTNAKATNTTNASAGVASRRR